MFMRPSVFRLLLGTFIVSGWLLAASAGRAGADGIDRFFGSYVGSGTAEHMDTGTTEQRDLDVSIEAFKKSGFTLRWITIVRNPDGERVGEGVKRREVEENFLPFEDREGVYILTPKSNLFEKGDLPNPLRGEPMRWAKVKDNAMTVYSMAIGETGGSVLQVYRRSLTEKGMDISFLRMRGEKVELRLDGTLVRAD